MKKRLNFDLIDRSDTPRILHRKSKFSFDDKIAHFEKFSLYSFNKESIKSMEPIYETCWILCNKFIKFVII